MIETLAKAFSNAGADLGEAMVADLRERNPEMAAKVAQALAQGERLHLAMVFDPVRPMVRLDVVDTAGTIKRVMHVAADMSDRLQ